MEKEQLVGVYHLQSVFQQEEANREKEIALLPCQKDDSWVLKPDRTFEIVDGGSSCEPSTYRTGEWALAGEGKLLLHDRLAEVVQWDGRLLVYRYTEVINHVNRISTVVLVNEQ